MTPILCDLAIDFDARTACEASVVEGLINQILSAIAAKTSQKVVVVLKNAHYLTMRAFSVLYNYIRKPRTDVVLVLISSDKALIFTPLLEYKPQLRHKKLIVKAT